MTKNKKFTAKVFSGGAFIKTITSDTISDLKRQASMACNGCYSVCDEMIVEENRNCFKAEYKFFRLNKKSPDGYITYGAWR